MSISSSTASVRLSNTNFNFASQTVNSFSSIQEIYINFKTTRFWTITGFHMVRYPISDLCHFMWPLHDFPSGGIDLRWQHRQSIAYNVYVTQLLHGRCVFEAFTSEETIFFARLLVFWYFKVEPILYSYMKIDKCLRRAFRGVWHHGCGQDPASQSRHLLDRIRIAGVRTCWWHYNYRHPARQAADRWQWETAGVERPSCALLSLEFQCARRTTLHLAHIVHRKSTWV